ncbi:MAG: GTP 3',8-cyclase MoaA [Reichenbachiella sp.]
MLLDKWGRQMDYLRIAITDRCNLRCFYCMPEAGITYMPKTELLTYEEVNRLATIFCSLGVNKIRITGGEPFLRRDLMSFLKELRKTKGLQQLHITTNGVLTTPHIKDFKKIGIDGVNLSLDSLNKENFERITRRDEFETVMNCLNELIAHEIPTKINTVVMNNSNTEEICNIAQLAENKNIDVRFIEEMPFNGSNLAQNQIWNHQDILEELKNKFPLIHPVESNPTEPATKYQIPNFEGKIGIIPAYTRTFCGSCNRIRLTAKGTIKNCLYDEGVLDLKNILRGGASDNEIRNMLLTTVQKKEKNGLIAEANRKVDKTISSSMSEIGG